MAAMIVELDDELLPPVSPKGFSSPSEQQHVSFSPEPTAKSPRSKSKHLGLSLRRITPEKKSQRALQASPSHGEQSNANSLMSRLTGRSRNSLATSATPVMRGGRRGDSTASAAPSDLASGYVSSTGTSVTPTTVNTGRSARIVSPLRGRNIEKMQKMEDEYYSPQAHWAEEEYEEEELDDGELPSLRRVSSAGSRGSLNRNWDNDRRNQSYRTSEGYEVQDGPSKAARAAAAAAAATLVTPTEGRRTTKEQLKVAGFWSQLDDDGGGGSGDDDRSDAPNDERQWRRSQSPPRDRGGARRVGWAEDVHNVHSNADESSIGLDLVPAKYDDDDATSAQKSKNSSSKGAKAESPSSWNLLEKAACYANEDKAGYEDDEDSDLKSGSRLAKDKYDAMDETYETDDQSLDRKATKKETAPDDEEEGMLACLTTALTTMCGYEVASAVNNACGTDAPTSPTKKRAHEIIAKDSSRRRSGAAALVSDGESTSYDGSETMDAVFEGLEEEEDVAVELQYHNEAGIGSPATSPQAKKKKRGLRKLLHLPGRKKNKEPLRKTVVTTTTRSGKDKQEGYANSKLTDYMHSLTFEQEILGEDGEAVPPPPPTDGMGSPTSVEQLKEEGNDETTEAKTAAAGAAAVGAAALAVGAPGGDDDDAELESQAAAWSTIEKNTYLRQLAERAKMDYAAKGGDGKTANDGSGGAGLAAAAAGAAAVGAAALAASGTTDTNDTRETTGEGTVEESTIGSINRNGTADTGVPDALKSSYNADYNSFSPAEKRQFLRLLNSGMTPQAAAKNIAAERVESPAVIEEEGEYDDAEENAHVTDRAGEGPTERATAYPVDEEMPSLMEPPGDVLSGASGESAELSTKEAHTQGASGSDQAQDGKGSRGKMAKLAAIATVPAMIAARKRSKDKSPKVYQGHKEDEKEEERPTTAAAHVGEEDEEEPAPAADGLISSGIGYYDGVDRGLDPTGQDNDDSYDNSGLLDASSVASPTSRRSRKKLLGAGAAAGLVAAKVATRKNRSSYKHIARDDNHVVSPGSPVNRGFDYDDGTKSDFTAKSSSRSLSSALKIVQRNKKAEKFSKLDADLALDQVQPSHTRSAEEEGTPSWLLPRDEEMEDGEQDARDEEEEMQGVDRDDDAPEDMEEKSVQEGEEEDSQAPSWSPALSPEMASAPPYASPRDVASEAGDANAVTPGQDNRAITSNAALHRPSPAGSQPSIYVAATRQHVGKTSVSLALVSHFTRRLGSENVGFMKAVGQQCLRVWDGPPRDQAEGGDPSAAGEEGGYVTIDKDVKLIRDHFRLDHLRYADMSPILIPRGYTKSYLDGEIDHGGQLADIRRAYLNIVRSTASNSASPTRGSSENGATGSGMSVTICEGTGHAGVGSVVGANNARVAAELGADVVLVANGGLGRAFDELELNRSLCLQHGVNIAGVVINKVQPDKFDQTRNYLTKAIEQMWTGPNGEPAPPILGVVPDRPYLGCPALADVESTFGSVLLSGSDHRYRHYDVGSNVQGRSIGMSMVTTDLAAFLRTMQRQPDDARTLFICHSTRDDVILGFLGEYRRRARRGIPFQSALVICTGGDDGLNDEDAELSTEVCEMITDSGPAGPPIIVVDRSPAEAAKRIRTMTPKFNASDERRVSRAAEHYEPYIDFDLLLERTSTDTRVGAGV